MSEESIFKDMLMQTLQTQQKMSDDIAEIKATIKEAAQIMGTLNRDVADVRSRLEKCERHPMECQAAKRHSAWAISLRDILFIIGAFGAVWALLNK